MHGHTNIGYQKSKYYLVNTANFGTQFFLVCLFLCCSCFVLLCATMW